MYYASDRKLVPVNLEEGDKRSFPGSDCSCSCCALKYAALPSYPPNTSDTSRSCCHDLYPMLDPPFAHEDEDRHPPNPFLFCPSHVDAFSLEHGSWKAVEVGALTDVDKSTGLFESLVLAQRSKSLLDVRVDDVINAQNMNSKNAVPGLIILLRGPPGTGKTATAGECLSSTLKAC